MSEGIRPGASWYVVAAGLVVFMLLAVAYLSMGLVHDVAGLFDLTTASVPGEFHVDVDEAGPYAIYVQIDRRSGAYVDSLPEEEAALTEGLRVEVVDEGGMPVRLLDPGDTRLTIQENGYVPWKSFAAPRPGRVTVKAAWVEAGTERELTLGVGPSLDPHEIGGMAGRIGGILLLCLVGGGGALAIFLVTFVKRRAARRRLEAEAVQRLIGDRGGATFP